MYRYLYLKITEFKKIKRKLVAYIVSLLKRLDKLVKYKQSFMPIANK